MLCTGVNIKLCKDRWVDLWAICVLLLCLCVNSWGGCRESVSNCPIGYASQCQNAYNNTPNGGTGQNWGYNCLSNDNGTGYCGAGIGGGILRSLCSGGSTEKLAGFINPTAQGVTCIYCSNDVSLDSIRCAMGIGVNCGDTETKEALEQACLNVAGVPHYNINQQGNVTGYCDLCEKDSDGNYTNPAIKKLVADKQATCCALGASAEGQYTCQSDINVCGASICHWDFSNVRGIGGSDFKEGLGCNFDVSSDPITGKPVGCEEYDLQNMSSSGGQNSSASQSSSSGDTTSVGENVQTIADGVGGILDSLHKIIVLDSLIMFYDSLTAVSNYGILNYLDTAQFGGSQDSIVVNVERDTNIINVNAVNNTDVSGLQMRQDTTNALLRRMIDSLSAVGGGEGDTAQAPAEILGVVKDGLQIDSARNGFLGSIDSILSDTTGSGGESDTAGMGGEIDGVMGQLDSLAGLGVPDMGDSIGKAVTGSGNALTALGDSLGRGAVHDSLTRWDGMITNNGVITGNGSDGCPSILTRSFNISVPFGSEQVETEFGNIGKYLCTPIPPFSTTLWVFCRLIIRALVSIACMYWIYKAVLGIDGGNDAED